jgi:hypothetical protein
MSFLLVHCISLSLKELFLKQFATDGHPFQLKKSQKISGRFDLAEAVVKDHDLII